MSSLIQSMRVQIFIVDLKKKKKKKNRVRTMTSNVTKPDLGVFCLTQCCCTKTKSITMGSMGPMWLILRGPMEMGNHNSGGR